VVAAAALDRLGRLDEAAEVLTPEVVLPQIGQGALAVECREDDGELRGLLAAIEHAPTRRAVDAERGFLASLGGGCELPAAAHAVVAGDGSARLTALLATLDGRLVLRTATTFGPGDEPGATGLALGQTLLDRGGGRALLAA
jgi:hydroxymethylbilane synthase